MNSELTNDELEVVLQRLAEVQNGYYVHIGDSE